jgi:hypothetical protein
MKRNQRNEKPDPVESAGQPRAEAAPASVPTAENPKEESEISEAPPAPLRTDGPTLAEYVARGYSAETYPPQGYAAREEREPAPQEFAGKPQEFLSLCNIAGHSWEKKLSPLGQWTFHECQNAACGRIVEVKPAS